MITLKSTPQSTHTDFALHTLGWKGFQDLCLAIAKESFGPVVQAFTTTHDGGRDGTFYGRWKDKAGQKTLSGSFTFQCKFTSKPNRSLAGKSLYDELHKAGKLAKKGLCKNYILFTNYSVSGKLEQRLRAQFCAIPGLKNFLVFGKEWLTEHIKTSPRLRMAVPRIYGLGDLSQILDERVYAQANDILFSMKDTLAPFVITTPYGQSVKALVDHGVVLLLGEPASGKTTIAASLCLAAADHWKAPTIKVADPHDFKSHWNPHEPHQVFWIDDAFGTTQFQKDRTEAWNHLFPLMAAAVKKGAKLIMTSRDYIFNAAKRSLKLDAFPLLKEAQVMIQVKDLSREEKTQIVYNHIKLGTQRTYFRKKIRPFLPGLAANSHFSPEIARRLGNREFTRTLRLKEASLLHFVEHPKAFLTDVLRTLDSHHLAALGIVFMRHGSVELPLTLSRKEQEVIETLSASPAGVRDAFRALQGSLIHTIQKDGNLFFTFKHPTIADAFSTLIADDHQLLDIYLEKTAMATLIQEITCGDVNLDGVKVIVPRKLYPVVARRLHELKHPDKLISFLSYRCDREFLKHVIRPELKTELLNTLRPPLSASTTMDLLSRLHNVGLLPEEWRQDIVQRLAAFAVEIPAADFLFTNDIQSLLTAHDIKTIMAKVRTVLVPNLYHLLSTWEANCPSDQPDGYFDPLTEALTAFKTYFTDEPDIARRLQDAIHRIPEMQVELIQKEWDRGDFDMEWLELPQPKPAMRERDIFDDVHE